MTWILAATGLAIWAAMSLLWLISLVRRDASIADAFWGPGVPLAERHMRAHRPEYRALCGADQRLHPLAAEGLRARRKAGRRGDGAGRRLSLPPKTPLTHRQR